MRPLALLVALSVCACTYNTNQPNNFGKSAEQPPPRRIERTPAQWCLDYCNRLRNCWDNAPDSVKSPGKTADQAFAECKKEHHDCAVDKTDNVLCCAELTSCGDFFQCTKAGAPAGC